MSKWPNLFTFNYKGEEWPDLNYAVKHEPPYSDVGIKAEGLPERHASEVKDIASKIGSQIFLSDLVSELWSLETEFFEDIETLPSEWF